MKNQVQKLQEIADSIKGVTNRLSTYKIKANNFAKEISKLDPKIVNYTEPFENGYYALKAVKCASSYLLARALGTEKFAYRQNNIFSPSLKVRDGEYARIDCSSFVSLCLKGIPYENSPYAKHKESNATWNPSEELEDMYGTEGWEFRNLDKQDKYHRDGETQMFTNIGIEGYSSIRTAAHLAQYFYKHGYVVYDRLVHGTLETLDELIEYKPQPGDLVFWANVNNTNQTVLERFRSISHVAMVAENTNAYYHVTGTEGEFDQTVVWYQRFDEGIPSGDEGDSTWDDDDHPIQNLLMICRPDYRPKFKVETPIGVNLIGYPWSQSRNKTFTVIGLTFNVLDEHSLKVNGTGTTANFGLKGYNGGQDHIALSAGTYQLSGIQNRTSTSFALQIRDANGNDFNSEKTIIAQADRTDKPIRYPVGGAYAYDTFTLTEETDVVVKLYCASSVTLVDEIITPTLMRIA